MTVYRKFNRIFCVTQGCSSRNRRGFKLRRETCYERVGFATWALAVFRRSADIIVAQYAIEAMKAK